MEPRPGQGPGIDGLGETVEALTLHFNENKEPRYTSSLLDENRD